MVLLAGMKQFLKGLVMFGIFAVPFLALYIANNSFFPYITGKNFLFRIIVEVIMVGWILLAMYDAEYRPRFSWVLASMTALVSVMLLSSLSAYHPHTALWGNYERMDGFVMLAHMFGYFVVVAHMFKTPQIWNWFFHTTIAVASLVVLYSFGQIGDKGLSYRIDSTFGNSTYMGIYMLFHIAILGWLALRSNSLARNVLYGVLALVFAFALVQTGTRGTVIGLVGGSVLSVIYVAVFGFRYPQVRKIAIGGCIALVALGGLFYTIKDSAPIQNHPITARIANIDLEKDLEIRRIIWGMAWEGVQERPILGWGIGNFNYIFNEKYDPRLYGQEQWFDRAHNIVVDWLVYGGFVGFIVYVSVFISALYYLVYRPWRYDDQTFTVLEQALLVGLLAGYTLHNMVVFDNLVSYIFFAVFLALIHSKVAETKPLWNEKISENTVTHVFAPVLVVALCFTVYFVNIPSMAVANKMIDALRAENINERYNLFDEALTGGSFAKQEVVEQFVQLAIQVSASENMDLATKEKFATRAEEEILAMIERKPNDARLHVFLASYYRATGQIEKAHEAIATARELSPNKQAIIMQQGANAMGLNKTEEALEFFEEAYRLDENNLSAKEYYVAMLFNAKQNDLAKEIIDASDEAFKATIDQSDFISTTLLNNGEYKMLAEIFERRLLINPNQPQISASLAYVYSKAGEKQKAIDTLNRLIELSPNLEKTANCWIDSIEKDEDPQTKCSANNG